VHGPELYFTAFAAALVISTVASPAGVSGAVLLLPFQVSVLGTPSPQVTPTNLLYNVIATPGALYRYWRQHQTGGGLTALLLVGTVPGIIAGSVVRVELLPGPQASEIVIAVVLIPLGYWLVANVRPDTETPWLVLTTYQTIALAALVGTVGGIYGIGGGSILAPILIGAGNSPRQVAPATLASTFVTSIVGVITFIILASGRHGSISPDWGTGLALGLGGLLGSYLGAWAQPHLPDRIIRQTLGLIVAAIGARYAYLAARHK
jgi:uncharacterized membrane protein YfcA